MEPVITNEDASRVIRDLLNIGHINSDTDNVPVENDLSTMPSNQVIGESDRSKSPHEVTAENSFDSFTEQGTPRISLDPVHQVVYLTSDEQKGCTVIYGNEVHITTSEVEMGRPTSAGSNRVRISPVVNFDWEPKYYNGNLLSVNSKYMSYALKGKTGFVLRILNRKTVLKALIKGFTGSIEDVSFAHYKSNLLACIDSVGDIFVWAIYEEDDKINYELRLHVKRSSDDLPFEGSRLIWCPHIDEEETEGERNEDDNVSEQILAVTCGNVAVVLHIPMITETYGNTVDINDIMTGIVRVTDGHKEALGDIALAPDGSVLATASEDGHVKFWQLQFDISDPPRCLHEWQPHDGKPLSRLIFCDSYLPQYDKNPFWRFLITGASHNSELKIWCTVTWTCLQTIRFQFPASNLCFGSPPPMKFKASLDLSAKYLVLSDINRKVLYVFLLHEDLKQGKAHVTSVAHFILTQPVLSFVITEAKMFKASMRDSMEQNGHAELQEKSEENREEDEQEEEEEEEGKVEGSEDDVKLLPTIKIKLHCINPRAMQELTVQYHPFASIRPATPSSVATASMTSAETGIQDGLSDVSGLDTSSTDIDDADTRSADVDTRSADVDTRSADADTRSADVDTRSADVDTRFADVDTRSADVDTRSAEVAARPKLIAPNSFTTAMPHLPSESTSITVSSSSITSVTSLTNSFGSVTIDELLGKSTSTKVSESTLCTFQTCEDDTLHEAASRGPAGFSPWAAAGHGSPPLHLPLPESPDPTKVPFPAFKLGARGAEKEKDPFAALMTHSTPIAPKRKRRSHEDMVTEKEDEDNERTPTAENAASPIEYDVSLEVNLEPSDAETQTDTTGPQDPETNEARASPSSAAVGILVDIGRLCSEGETVVLDTEILEPTSVADVQQSVPDDGNLSSEILTHEQPLQATKMRSNLVVTPRRQINIPPEAPPRVRDEDDLKLNEILSLLRAQKAELAQVKDELHSQQQQQNQGVSELLREEIAMLEGAVSTKVEAILIDHEREQDQRFDRFARENQTNEKQKQDKLATSLTTALSNKVEKAVKNEIRNSFSLGFQKLAVPMQDQIDTTMSQKLTAVDAVVKESIQKMVKDKSVVDAIGDAVSNTTHVRLQATLSEFFSQSMLPSFEKVCQSMFAQLNSAFQKGTQQYLRNFESNFETEKALQKEQRDPIVQQLQSLVETFQTASEKLSTSMSGSLLEMMQTQLTSSMKRLQSALMAQLQEDLTKSLQETIQQEVRTAVAAQNLNEAANYPDPHGHLKRAHLRIQQLIKGQEFGEAFQEALTAGDLGLVVMVCQACDPVELFGQDPCPLSQPILLSLIQQLSVNLSDDTELKHRYLDEAVVALDTSDPITREHVSTILEGLQQQIMLTIPTLSKTGPSNSLLRSLKRLLMAAQSLITK